MLEFAKHVMLNARRMWSEFPMQHRRRMQKVLFPEGLAYDGEAFRTAVACLFFRNLESLEREEYELVARLVPTSNLLFAQLTAFEALKTAAL